nr:hypothetical protein [bacterium]
MSHIEPTLWLHIVASIAALISGFAVLRATKGTSRHRLLGFIYVTSMYTLCIASFFVHRFSGHFSIFHYVSIQNILLITAGLAMPRYFRRRSFDWQLWHLRLMIYSYISLVGTGLLQFFNYLPLSEAPRFIFFFAIPLAASWVYLARWSKPLRKNYRQTSS